MIAKPGGKRGKKLCFTIKYYFRILPTNSLRKMKTGCLKCRHLKEDSSRNKLISVSTNSAPPWYTELFYTEIEILCGLLMTILLCWPTISNVCVCNGFKSFSTNFLWKCLPWLPGWGSYIIFNGKVGGIKDKHASTDWILTTLLFLFSSWLYVLFLKNR